MKIKNTTKEIEFENIKLCRSFGSLMKGLMFKKEGKALLDFKKEGFYGIWMLFMRFSLDMAFLNKNKEIVDIKRNIRPISINPKTWKTFYPKKSARYVLEVEKGKLKDFEIGDQLEF